MVHTHILTRNPWRLLTNIFTTVIIISFISPVVTSPAYALAVPQPQYPIDYSNTTTLTNPPLGVPYFKWSGVSGASLYRLQVDNDPGFADPIILNTTTSNTSFTPSSLGSLFSDGNWYWRVRVEAPAPVGNWSTEMHFTKTWATPDNKPVLIEPQDGAELAFFDSPTFSWSWVTGASRYRLQIATNPDFTTLIPTPIQDTISTSYQPAVNLANATYYWRVIPIDNLDHFGTYSEVRSFTVAYGKNITDLVPALLEPKEETFPTFTPTFHWTAIKGAEHYKLEYTSDETCDFSVGTSIETRQTSYTPTDTFPNDKRYCWHVRVESGLAIGDWSDTWHFQKQWYLQPQLLTPTNLYQNTLYPLFSWTPVPGAARYKIEVATDPSFTYILDSSSTANTTYSPQSNYIGTAYYYWRVTPIDGGGELGLTSAVREFRSYYDSLTPVLIYPLYYYLPNNPVYYDTYTMNPVENRTVPYPIFIWHRVMVPAPTGGVYAQAYRIQVATTPYFGADIIWQIDTENNMASPTDDIGNDFSPLVGQDYYWRVCVLDHIGGDCVTDPHSGWSQIWKARFDPALALSPTKGEIPELLRPAMAQESVEATPLLEWWPLQNATQYQVEVNRDPEFLETPEFTETINIPAYAPVHSIAQRRLGMTEYGTFYWHVRAKVSGVWSNWSATSRFQIASQSEWQPIRTLGNNQLLIAEDPANDVITTTTDLITSTYDLTTLYAAQSEGQWFLGFNVDLTATDTTYVFYIDLDHVDGSGADTPPEYKNNVDVNTIPAHRPEFAIYLDKIAGEINAENTWVFAWNGSAWEYGQLLSDIGGAVYASGSYVELQLPNASIGMSQVTGSASVNLFSVDSVGMVKDSVPSDPQAPAESGITPQLSRFSAVSERMNLIFPPNTDVGDPTTIPSLLPFYWEWPTGSHTNTPADYNDAATPFAGVKLEVHLDPAYTNRVGLFTISSSDRYFSENNITFLNDLVGDNIYYWRVQPRYFLGNNNPVFGAWTSGWTFRRLGFVPQNLKTSVTWATPTFSWDMVEGANIYRLQVSTQSNFGSTIIDTNTPLTSYTPFVTLAQGLYYWRVQVIRFNTPANDWSEIQNFNLTLPVPSGLTPTNGSIVSYAPTFCWNPIEKLSETDPFEPILSAWKYRVQVSRDQTFSIIYDSIDTFNHCWTPIKGYDDGNYYWHVAMIDGNNRLGPYSTPTNMYLKQYPVTTLISPIDEYITGTPTFIWTPVDGAAIYRLEVSLYPTFSPTYDSAETFNTRFTPTKVYDPDIIYYWRVAIRDRDGKQGPYTGSTIIIEYGSKIYLPLIIK